jgi:glucose-6-phosphate isomerase
METICQTLLIIEFYKKQLINNNSQNLYFITESGNQDNPLAKIAHAHNREIIEHDKDIGGRYSCLTPVSLIAAAFYNIKIADYLDGAEVLINNFLDSRSDIIANGVYFLQQCQKRHLNTQVFMPYLGRLYHFNYWYNQLFAESIGKQNKGITPLKAIGSTDQHSILQLFLDGPKDKSFTFLTTNNQNKGSQIIVPDYLQEDVNYLNNNKLGDVIYANQESTIKTIKNKNHILRRFDIETLDEFALGQIMAYFMLETIFYAKIIGVNPFDQPAVEEGKIYAKEKLFNNN